MNQQKFTAWSDELEAVWDLRTEEDYKRFSKIMSAVTGHEEDIYLEKLIDAIRLKEDFGAYESLYNAIWSFPSNVASKCLARRLPALQKMMGKYDQVSRFYIPVTHDGVYQPFVEQAALWSSSEKKSAIIALKKWAVENESWETLLEKLGYEPKKTSEDAIPDEWDNAWKERLTEGRARTGEYSISSIFWKKGKPDWLQDLDFLIEMLSLDHGKNWRQVDAMTTPLWGFARTTIYPLFIQKLKMLPEAKIKKILHNIKRVNKLKFEGLTIALK